MTAKKKKREEWEKKADAVPSSAVDEEDLSLPFEHLIVVLMELGRDEWYCKIIDRRTQYSTSAGGSGRGPVALVEECWERLCRARLAGGGCSH